MMPPSPTDYQKARNAVLEVRDRLKSEHRKLIAAEKELYGKLAGYSNRNNTIKKPPLSAFLVNYLVGSLLVFQSTKLIKRREFKRLQAYK